MASYSLRPPASTNHAHFLFHLLKCKLSQWDEWSCECHAAATEDNNSRPHLPAVSHLLNHTGASQHGAPTKWRLTNFRRNDVWNNLGPSSLLQQVGDTAKYRARKSGRDGRWLCVCLCIRVCKLSECGQMLASLSHSSSWFTSHSEKRDSQGKNRWRRMDRFISTDTHAKTLCKKKVHAGDERDKIATDQWPPCTLSHPETNSQRADRLSEQLNTFPPPFHFSFLPSLSSSSSSSSPLMSMGCASNLAACFTSHTAPVQNSYRPPDGGVAFLLAVPDYRPQ